MSGEQEPGASGRRRGLGGRHVRRGQVAKAAIQAIRATRSVLKLAVEILLAAIIVFEEWGWQPLSAALARLARIAIVARLEAAVAALPPWPALAVFLLPTILFTPLKLLALWLIASGKVILASLLFIFAKIAGTALYARLLQLTKPALMRLSWFAAAYNWFMPWKDRLLAHVRETAVWQRGTVVVKRIKAAARQAWSALRPNLEAAAHRIRALIRRS